MLGGGLDHVYDFTPLYRALPDLIVQPASKEEITSIVKVANKPRILIVCRGSGTSGIVGVQLFEN